MKLSQIDILNKLEEDEGIHLDVEIYKPIDVEKADGKFGVFISQEKLKRQTAQAEGCWARRAARRRE